MVRRDTALLLRDFRQGASNWIHSLLDSNRASAAPSTAVEAPPGATGIPPTVMVCMGVFVRDCAVGSELKARCGCHENVLLWRPLCSKFSIDAIYVPAQLRYQLCVCGVCGVVCMCVCGGGGSRVFIKPVYIKYEDATSTAPVFITIWRRLLAHSPVSQHPTNQLSPFPAVLRNTCVAPFISIHLFGAAGL